MEKSLQYWWLNVIPKEDDPDGWALSEGSVGEIESYSLYHESGNKRQIPWCFLAAKKGDIVIGYATHSHKRIEALLKVAAEQDGEDIYFEKTEVLKVPVTRAELREYPELANMRYFKNPRGSLFPLTESEYVCIMNLIRAKNP